MRKPNPQCDGMWKCGAFGRWLGHERRGTWMGLMHLKKETTERPILHSTSENTVGRGTYEWGSSLSLDNNLTSTLFFNVPASRTLRNEFLISISFPVFHMTCPFSQGHGLPWWLRQYSICLQWGRPGFNPWVGKIPWRRKWHPAPVLLPGKSHGQKILVGYGPWGRKESDSAAWLHFLSAKTVCLICFFWQCSLLVVSWLAILVIWFQFKCYLLREAFPDHTVS